MGEEGKPWWASKTVWAGVVGLASTAATAFGVHVLDDPKLQAEIVGVFVSAAAIALRFVTSQPIK